MNFRHNFCLDDEIWRAISRLTPKLRVVIVLRYYWDLSYAEVTQVLNLPLGTVKSRLNQALQMMKRDLETSESWQTHSSTLGDLPAELQTGKS